MVHTFKPNFFLYSCQLTTKYSTLTYIAGSFSLTQLLTMFAGATFYSDTV